jgi:hypothetical protein
MPTDLRQPRISIADFSALAVRSVKMPPAYLPEAFSPLPKITGAKDPEMGKKTPEFSDSWPFDRSVSFGLVLCLPNWRLSKKANPGKPAIRQNTFDSSAGIHLKYRH